MIMDLDMIVRKVRDLDSLFGYETPAACLRGNRENRIGVPRQFDAQPIHEGRMIGGINAGLMILSPSKSDFARMKCELALETAEPTFGPEQDFLSRFYPEWKKIPLEFNYQLHQLQYLSRDFRPCDQPERRLRFEEIKVIHYSGDYSPCDWIFYDNGFDQFDSWVEKHLMPKYGNVDEVDKPTLMKCIQRWAQVWERVRGQIIIYNRREDAARGAGCHGRPVTCRPWVDEDMPLPEHEEPCENCARWSLPLRTADQDESSLGRAPRSGQHRGPGRRKKGGKGQCSHRKGGGRGRQQDYQTSRQQPHQQQRGRSRTPRRQQVGRQSPASRQQERRQNSACRQQDLPPGMRRGQEARLQAPPAQRPAVIGARVTGPSLGGSSSGGQACQLGPFLPRTQPPTGQPKPARVRKSSSKPGHGTWR